MLPHNRSGYQTHMMNPLFSNIPITNILQSQRIDNSNMRTLHLSGKPSEEIRKHLKDSDKANDLINLNDEFDSIPQPTTNNDNEKEINDYQIKMLEEFLSSAGGVKLQTSETYTPEQEIQFKRFFDKYEASTKSTELDNAINKSYLAKKELHSPNLQSQKANTKSYTYNSENPSVLIPKLHRLVIVENKEEIEDLIDEVLLDKKLEKQQHSNPSDRKDSHYQIAENNKLRHNSVTNDVNSACTDNRDIMNEIITKNDIIFPTSKEVEKHYDMINSKVGEINRDNLTKHLQTPYNDGNLKSNTINIKINELVSKHNLKYLEAIKMDDNIFRKRSLLKSESDLLHLTPGPTLHEKSVVLPQIMQRMAERKKTVDELRNMKPKLILDAGTSYPISADKTKNPDSVSDAVPSSRIFHEKINFPTQTATHISTLNTNSTGVAKPTMMKTDQRSPAHASGSNQNACKISQGRGNVRYIPIEELKTKRQEGLLQSQSGQFNLDSENPQVLRPPQVLMEDCNRERYLSYATGRLFVDDFIYKK